jgi:hypothetical protein
VRHLYWRELACHDGAKTPYPAEWRETRLPPLRHLFETIRRACGDRPIRVLSAYRTSAHNRRIGGARHSQHIEGRALDLRPPTGMTIIRFASIVDEIIESQATRIGGVGRYRRYLHVDVRPRELTFATAAHPSRPRLVRWSQRRTSVKKA